MRRLALFVAGLVLVFGAAFAAGRAIGGDGTAHHAASPAESITAGGAGDEHGEEIGGSHGEAARGPGAVDRHDLRLQLDAPTFPAGREAELAFRVLGPAGEPISSFEEKHTKPLHLIVVRRDLTFFEHVHPEPDAQGTWRTRLRLDSPGDYRVIADVTHEKTDLALPADLRVPGEPLSFSTPPREDYDVGRQVRDLKAGEAQTLRFEVEYDGRPIKTEPYLGAAGHLVVMAKEDLEYLHVHPETDELAFEATFSEPGEHALFLEYKHRGRVRVARFEVEVGA